MPYDSRSTRAAVAGIAPTAAQLTVLVPAYNESETLADTIHPFPAFNRVLGESLQKLAAQVAAPNASVKMELQGAAVS